LLMIFQEKFSPSPTLLMVVVASTPTVVVEVVASLVVVVDVEALLERSISVGQLYFLKYWSSERIRLWIDIAQRLLDSRW
jgi:hypothetical protein